MTTRETSFGLSDARMLLEQLRIAARSDGASPKSFALLLRRVFEERAWELEGFGTFRAYVEAREPQGLDMTEEKLLDAARLADIEPLVRQLLYAEVSVAPQPIHAGPGRGHKTDCVTNGFKPDRVDHVVARLKRDDPALAERVVRGEVTPNAAAREKGWRKPRIVLSTPERVAASLRKWMPREALTRLAELLSEPEDKGEG